MSDTACYRQSCIGGDSKTLMTRVFLPIKLFACFGALGYLLTVLWAFLPSGWNLPSVVGVLLCPSCLMFATEDVSRSTALLALGLVNAALYGVMGFAIGKLLSPRVNE